MGKQIHQIRRWKQKIKKVRKDKKDELNELLANDERIENIYKAEDKKGSTRKFNTLNNRRKHLDKNTGGFLANPDKKTRYNTNILRWSINTKNKQYYWNKFSNNTTTMKSKENT